MLRGVGRRYGLRGPWVLRGLDLDLPARALVRIEGANGVGKSTLLRLLAGVDVPAEGRVTGRPRTAYVPERFPAALPFTAAGYLVHMGRVHGLPSAEAAARAEDWLTRFGAAGHARTPLAELSKGTCQKVAVAQALLAQPDLLVLDEAWTGLDTAARDALDLAVAERVADGATVVFVDHDPKRLAGQAGLTYRLEGRTLVPALPPGDTGPQVRIEATGEPSAALPPALPGAPTVERDAGNPAAIRLTTTAADSDPILRALLTATPPWHITALRQLPSRAQAPAPIPAVAEAQAPAPAQEAVPVAAPTAAPGAVPGAAPAVDRMPRPRRPDPPRPPRSPVRGAVAVMRCQAALLGRSQRWLAPLLLYAAVLGIGLQAGQPLLDSLGYAAAVLVPVAAWFVRLCVTQEPPAARAVTASAVGPSRAHRATLLTGLGCALALGGVGTVIVVLMSEPASNDHSVAVPLLPAVLAGLLAAGCCALLGAAVGALCARPVLHRHGWSLIATMLGALLALVTEGSPARAAVSSLVSGSLTGTVRMPLLPLAGAVVVAVAVAALTSRIAALRE
ncbi:ATP-binding cassette domain-containing protein [Streptomyces sp. NPDC048565]|uniref:ATP-binding cassette domain-containing protein n=1 Tax=Streptomyces sp. NPDC048565 TaxID=3155266 RepID=UPI00341C6EAB